MDTGERPPCGGHAAGDKGGRRREGGGGTKERAQETEPSVGKARLGPQTVGGPGGRRGCWPSSRGEQPWRALSRPRALRGDGGELAVTQATWASAQEFKLRSLTCPLNKRLCPQRGGRLRGHRGMVWAGLGCDRGGRRAEGTPGMFEEASVSEPGDGAGTKGGTRADVRCLAVAQSHGVLRRSRQGAPGLQVARPPEHTGCAPTPAEQVNKGASPPHGDVGTRGGFGSEAQGRSG